MNHRLGNLLRMLVVGLSLALIMGKTNAQGILSVLTNVYGDPVLVFDDPADDLFICQDPSTSVGGGPSDITRIEVYETPDNAALFNGFVLATYTREPFQQLLDTSYSASAAARALDSDGNTDNRLIAYNDGEARIGAGDGNLELIDGTSQLAGVSPDGAAAVFFFPWNVTRVSIRTFHTAESKQPAVCDSAPNDRLLTLPLSWAASVNTANPLATVQDDANDTAICTTTNSAAAPQADITDINVYGAPADAPNPDSFIINIRTAEPPDVASGAFRYTVNLNVQRGSGAEENWLLDVVRGQTFNRRLDGENAPVPESIYSPENRWSSRWGDYSSTTIDPDNVQTGWFFNIPRDTTQFRVTTSVTTTEGGQTVCDGAPSGSIRLPAIQSTSAESAPEVTICPSVQDSLHPSLIQSVLDNRNPLTDNTGTFLDSFRVAPAGLLDNPAGTQGANLLANPLVWKTACNDPAQSAAPTAPPVEEVYGAPVGTIADGAGDSILCQEPATSAGDNPADITEVNIYRVPDSVASHNGYLIAINTRDPFQELFDTAYSATALITGVTVTGARANRILENYDQAQRTGAIADNNQLIGGTNELVGFAPDGGALFNLPPGMTSFRVITFFSESADQPSRCDSTETINLPAIMENAPAESSAALTLCPPLDRSDPNSGISAGIRMAMESRLRWGGPSGTHLELQNPRGEWHPLFNPLVWKDRCEGEAGD